MSSRAKNSMKREREPRICLRSAPCASRTLLRGGGLFTLSKGEGQAGRVYSGPSPSATNHPFLLTSTRQCFRVEFAVTHTKQSLGASATRQFFKGVLARLRSGNCRSFTSPRRHKGSAIAKPFYNPGALTREGICRPLEYASEGREPRA